MATFNILDVAGSLCRASPRLPASAMRSAVPELQRQWPIRSLALFGSPARDDATPASDLDVLVTFLRPVPLSSFLALEERLAAITGRR